ncbi:helix-turn-helix transcriptional regulator [Leptolyngbya sp. AN02str]|uniref:helix-turn-helix transcriptional regulator n=1 Tax=Leptolyngbya sp. AN02str TaxID=3423363 RepID=UPI003D31CCD2
MARQVGLNDHKLKQGFRHVFGTTAFGYLRDHRLQQAKELLHDSNQTIAKIATTVGYKSPEAFCNAFRRKFTISPRAYQLSQRG